MDSTAILAFLHAYGLDVYAPAILVIVGVLAQIMPIIPVPAAGSAWVIPYRIASVLAGNWGNAKNAAPAPSVGSPPPAALGLILVAALGLSACTTQQLATVQTAANTAVADGQLFCSRATPYGPLVVALADATASAVGAPGAISVIGKTSDYVARTCAVIGAIPVVPPANPAATPVVAVVPPA
jgi:hypothetical protein